MLHRLSASFVLAATLVATSTLGASAAGSTPTPTPTPHPFVGSAHFRGDGIDPADRPAAPDVQLANSTTTTNTGTSGLADRPAPLAFPFNNPNAYVPPTLKIRQQQPVQPIEGQPIQVTFQLTNNSSEFPLSGSVLSSWGLFGAGGQGIDHLAAGASISGVVSEAAPPAMKGLAIDLNFQGAFDDGTGSHNLGGGVTCGNCAVGTPTSATAVGGVVDVRAVYYIEMDSFFVNETRSNGVCCSTDTDYIAMAAQQEPEGPQPGDSTHSFGAISVKDGGPYTPGPGTLVLGPYYAVPDDTNSLAFNYAIVNSGHQAADDVLNAMIQALLQGIGAALGTAGGTEASASANTSNSLIGASSGNAIGSLLNPLFANCDGTVAVDGFGPYTGGGLASMTASGQHSETHDYPGTNSPGGCGDNSEYHVTWHISRGNP